MTSNVFLTSQKTPISLIHASCCVFYSFHSKNPQLSQQEILSQAYKAGALDLQKTYLSYFIYQELSEKYLCFFAPSSGSNPAVLDITLPLLRSQICCIFLSRSKNLFCFYQDKKLVFYKEFDGDFTNCLRHIEVFFNHKIEKIYCLCDGEDLLETLQADLIQKLTPLLSLYDSSLGFSLTQVKSPIILEHFHNLNPTPPNQKLKQLKTFSALIFSFFLASLLLCLCAYIYRSYLLHSLDKLNQNISSSSFLSPIEEIKYLQEKNQQALSLLSHYATLEKQRLNTIFHILSYFDLSAILSIHFKQSILIQTSQSFDLSPLLSYLDSIAYRCKVTKEENFINLEISKI